MNKKERIFNKRITLASNAALKLKAYEQKSDAVKKSEQIERAKANVVREAKRPQVEKVVAASERILRGKDNSNVKPPTLKIESIGKPVARLHEIYAIQEPKGFGTGFLVAPNLLITNHHVFEDASSAVDCVANFEYQFDLQTEQVTNGYNFKLRPDIFFLNNEQLDFALVFVDDQARGTDKKLSNFGFLPLIETKGKANVGSPMNIIQYPQGGVKKYTLDDNEIFNIDDEQGIIYYYTDTEVGSSGSPGFNDFWEVSALHYTGVPNTNKNGQWLTRNGEIWDKHTMSENEVDWIANAGKSISRIVVYLKSLQLPPGQNKYVQSILAHTGDPLNTKNNAAPESTKSTSITHSSNLSAMSKYNFNFHGNVNLNINDNGNGIHQEETNRALADTILIPVAVEKKERFDEDYSNRIGYLEDFIPGFKVPMPNVTEERDNELYKNFGASVPYIVPYHHYSLVMNKKRRMAMWAASNVDYNEKFRDERSRENLGSGAWRLDPRIPAKYQIQASEFYDPATLVDKGHIVRRDDNCWASRKGGRTDSLGIEYANADTFHWTNCTPQHEAFNRDMVQYTGIGKWGVLENAIKEQLELIEGAPDNDTKDYGQKACVLAGPVLSEDDPEYMDIQYPLKFWKVFAINSLSAGKLVYGFILSQEDKVNEMGMEKEARPRFNRMVKAMQASLEKIESYTGIIFDEILHTYDVKRGDADDATESLRDDLSNFKAMRLKVS